MTREELKEHCKRQVQQFERVEKIMPVTPNDWKRYEEHKLILELLEQEPILNKIRAEIEPKCDRINSLASVLPYTAHREIQELLCEIMDLCKAEIEPQESEES